MTVGKRVLMLWLFLLTSGMALAQDFKKATAEARDTYAKIQKLHAVIEVHVFESEGSKTPFYKLTADLKRDNQKCIYKFGANDLLINDRYMVLIDKDAKEINYSKYDAKAAASVFKDPIKVNYDSILRQYGSPAYLGRESKIDHYQMALKEGALSKIDFFMNIETKLIQKIFYAYREGQFVVVEFKQFNQHPQFDVNVFSENQYFTFNKAKSPVPSSLYKGFNVSIVENK